MRCLLRHVLTLASALVLLPLGLAALAIRPVWARGLGQRLGWLPASASPGCIWIHAASVGEGRSALPLIEALRAGGAAVRVTSTTLSGREAMAQRLARCATRDGPDAAPSLAPLDHPYCVGLALDRLSPSCLVLVETEVWPCLIAAAGRRGVRVVVVSGRLSDSTFARLRRLRALVAPTFRRLDAVAARTPLDADRFVALGAHPDRVLCGGDLKRAGGRLDRAPSPVRAMEGVSLIVAGSTHEGEEEAALQALDEIESQGLRVALVLAPRHPERAPSVARTAREAGRTVHRHSRRRAGDLASGEVLVLDTLGDLSSVYAEARAAFVGGSLVPRGGHNLLEPVWAGCPVAHGRHVEKQAESARRLRELGAAAMVDDGASLGSQLALWLADPKARERAREAARALSDAEGVVKASLAMILDRTSPV